MPVYKNSGCCVLDILGSVKCPIMSQHRLMGILILLISVNPAFTGYSWNPPQRAAKVYKEPSSFSSPQFEDTVPTDVSVIPGHPVFLPCTVRNLGDKLVSWIRTRDLHILTSGKHTFTADGRFDVIYSPDDETWTLTIKNSKISDGGKYECQVNTDPKMNKFFELSVKEPPLKDSPVLPEAVSAAVKASISGPRDQFVKIGSTVTFECMLSFTRGMDKERYHPKFQGRQIPNVQWQHEGLAVSFQAERGGISVETERGERSGSSHLTVASVRADDAGRYTCTGTGVASDSILLHVIEGEHMEAMQRDEASGSMGINSLTRSLNVFLKTTCILTYTISFITIISFSNILF